MSSLTQAMLINAVVLIAVLEADLGPHRKIGWWRILRPLGLAAGIIPLYLEKVATQGPGLTLEIIGTLAGVLVGLAATSLVGVYRSPGTGKPVSRAGLGYAVLWIVIVGARAAFSYGSEHWFSQQLGTWMVSHQVSADAIVDTLILMAVGMLLTRTLGLAVRVSRLAVPA